MDDRLSQLDAQVDALSGSLRELERRLCRIEGHLGLVHEPLPAAVAQEPAEPAAPAPARRETDSVSLLSFVGRTLLGLAGAYLLRAFTSEGLLPQAVGVAAGLLYAALWLFSADRAAARGRAVSTCFHGATAALASLPLIWETTTRLGILPPAAGAAALAGMSAMSLTVAWRRAQRSLAWILPPWAGLAALMLGGITHAPVPFTAFLVALGVASLWLARAHRWRGLPWVTAILADLAVLLLWAEDPIAEGWASAAGVLATQLALFGLYGASFAHIAWRRGEAGLFAALQTAAVLTVGYGGALSLASSLPAGGALLGGAGLGLALVCYGVAFATERRQKRSIFYFTGLALPLLLVGCWVLFERPGFVYSLLALTCAWAGNRFERLVLSLHAALYALAAVIASRLLFQATAAFAADADAVWPSPTLDGLLALAAIAGCLVFPARGDIGFWGRWAGVPRLLLLALGAWGTGGVLVWLLTPLTAGAPADPAILATLRTGVLAVAVLALARAGRWSRLREAAQLVHPLLLIGAVKLLVEDFSAGRSQTLVLSLALYGAALILGPRLKPAKNG